MAKQSPPQLLADEKHTWWRGEKVYVATTVAEGCLLGAELSQTAGSDDLQAAYGVFADEARELNPDYQPQTVNTDGWEATQKAWKNLFSGVTLILCFLHTILSIEQRCRPQKDLLNTLKDKLWDVYHACDPIAIYRTITIFTSLVGSNLNENAFSMRYIIS